MVGPESPKMGEQQLAEVLVDGLLFALLGHLYPAVAQGKAHQLAAPGAPLHQGTKEGVGFTMVWPNAAASL